MKYALLSLLTVVYLLMGVFNLFEQIEFMYQGDKE